jgi:hypothetical protein
MDWLGDWGQLLSEALAVKIPQGIRMGGGTYCHIHSHGSLLLNFGLLHLLR